MSHLGQAFLFAGEAEREPERKDIVVEIELGDELDQALGDVVEQLLAGARHDVGRDGENLGFHVALLVLVLVDLD